MKAEGYLTQTEIDDMDEENLVAEVLEFVEYMERKAAATRAAAKTK